MQRVNNRRPAHAIRVIAVLFCMLAVVGGAPYGVLAADKAPDATVTVYLPLLVSWGVRVLPNHFFYVSSLGSLWIVGEVQNDTTQYLEFIDITANVIDGDGALLASAYAYVDLDVLPPGEKSCFDILVGPEPQGWSTYRFEPPTFRVTSGPLPDLTITDDSGSYKGTTGRYGIEGHVRNDHGQRVEYARVVGTVYTSSGLVLGCRNGYVDGLHLDPGQSASFDLLFSGRDYVDVQSYRLQTSGSLQ